MEEDKVKSRNKRDTKKWCRGKVGVEHQWEWINTSKLPNRTQFPGDTYLSHFEVQYCHKCGKQGKLKQVRPFKFYRPDGSTYYEM